MPTPLDLSFSASWDLATQYPSRSASLDLVLHLDSFGTFFSLTTQDMTPVVGRIRRQSTIHSVRLSPWMVKILLQTRLLKSGSFPSFSDLTQ